MRVGHFLKYLYIIIYKFVLRLTYTTLTLFNKQDGNKAVFILSRGSKLEGNLKFIHDELLHHTEGVKIHFVFTENKMNLNLFKELFGFYNAKYLLLDDYYLPIYLIKPKKEMKIIQLWHAAGAFKKFGHSTVGTTFGPNENYLKLVPIHSNYTHVYVSSKNVVKYYAEAFNMDSTKIYPLGIPRIDLFTNETIKHKTVNVIYAKYPCLKNEDTVKILLAPTYRAKGIYKESTHDIVNTMIDVSKNLVSNTQVLFKKHPYMANHELKQLEQCDNIMVIDDFSINEWMLVVDAFITDYSSAVFDFSILNRPLAHYVPDIKEYEGNRGLYEKISVVSDGVIIKKIDELIKWINDRKRNEFYDTSRMVQYNFDYTKDISKKIVNHFIHF